MIHELRIGDYLPSTYGNGPGLRAALWVQGCPFHCSGCWNPQFLAREGGQTMSVDAAFDMLTRDRAIEGVTFLGGEPFTQSEPLGILAARCQDAGLGVISYSGYIYEELLRAPQHATLLDNTDLLIDGPYIAAQAAELPWRGSSNQRLIPLTDRYAHLMPLGNAAARTCELEIIDGCLLLTGDPPAGCVEAVAGILAGAGHD